MSRTEPPLDLDEDLFDFPAVAPEADAPLDGDELHEIFAALRPSAGDLFDVPAAPASAPAAPAHAASAPSASTATPAETPPASLPRVPGPSVPGPRVPVPSVSAPSVLAPAAPASALVPPPARRALPLSRGVVAIVLAVTVLNSALAVVALRRPAGPRAPAAVEPAPEHVEARETRVEDAAAVRDAALPDPETLDVLHAHPTLDRARAEIRRGEYAAARQRVYGLLAIIDRLQEPRRSALEADCQYLIAEALHLEALARMGAPR